MPFTTTVAVLRLPAGHSSPLDALPAGTGPWVATSQTTGSAPDVPPVVVSPASLTVRNLPSLGWEGSATTSQAALEKLGSPAAVAASAFGMVR